MLSGTHCSLPREKFDTHHYFMDISTESLSEGHPSFGAALWAASSPHQSRHGEKASAHEEPYSGVATNSLVFYSCVAQQLEPLGAIILQKENQFALFVTLGFLIHLFCNFRDFIKRFLHWWQFTDIRIKPHFCLWRF